MKLKFWSKKDASTKDISQKQLVINHLKKRGSITSWEAITEYNITRLSAIIHVLKRSDGMNISSTLISANPDGGRSKQYSLYTLNS